VFGEGSRRRRFIASDQRSASGKWLRWVAKAAPLSFPEKTFLEWLAVKKNDEMTTQCPNIALYAPC
jgi:hypothetical protein